MLKQFAALVLAFGVGLAHAQAINVKVKPPKGLPGPEVKVKVGDGVKVKGEKSNHGKHKGASKGKKNGH